MADRHEWFLNQIFRHRADLQRYLQRFTSGAEDIEDLIQETYVRVYSLDDYDAVASPKRTSLPQRAISPSNARGAPEPKRLTRWRTLSR